MEILKSKLLILIITAQVAVFFIPKQVVAHSGRTSSDGCHYCRTNCSSYGYTYGTRHNHYGNSCSCADPVDPLHCRLPSPIPTISQISLRASFLFSQTNNRTFTVHVKLIDPSPSSYSVALNKYGGVDPGPYADFSNTSFDLKNVANGKWFLNIKKQVNGYWSNIYYWEFETPQWMPSPTSRPTAIPTVTPTISATSFITVNPTVYLNRDAKEFDKSNFYFL